MSARPTAEIDAVSAVLVEHRWHISIWGDTGGYGWRCSCGIVDTGTGSENPARFIHHATREDARAAAVEHIVAALTSVTSPASGDQP